MKQGRHRSGGSHAAEAAAARVAAEQALELVELTLTREQQGKTLCIYIDKPGGVTIDDCELVSRTVDPILDEADPIEQQYYLSVSSLGLDRPLKKDADYQRNLGKQIEVKLFAPLNGKKEFKGELVRFDETCLVILDGETERTLERKTVALARPELKF